VSRLFSTKIKKIFKEGSEHMIKVCDAIMGAGKTEAAVNYMNLHSNDKFIFITPFLQ
jgi:CRISPR/Cas system-associated endonuclease/helicase Cas3